MDQSTAPREQRPPILKKAVSLTNNIQNTPPPPRKAIGVSRDNADRATLPQPSVNPTSNVTAKSFPQPVQERKSLSSGSAISDQNGTRGDGNERPPIIIIRKRFLDPATDRYVTKKIKLVRKKPAYTRQVPQLDSSLTLATLESTNKQMKKEISVLQTLPVEQDSGEHTPEQTSLVKNGDFTESDRAIDGFTDNAVSSFKMKMMIRSVSLLFEVLKVSTTPSSPGTLSSISQPSTS